MLPKTIQLETLRQQIEDASYKAGDLSDYLDRGRPNAAQAKQAQASIAQFNSQAKAKTDELKQLLEATRSQNSQAVNEWVDFHVTLLQKIVAEKSTDANAAVRRNVANGTIQEWEKVRAGEQVYVNINGYFLKDYKAEVRKITEGHANQTDNSRQEKPVSKAWWQFWK